jgi:hypothetical protein
MKLSESSVITEGGGHVVISTELFSDLFDVQSLPLNYVIRIPKVSQEKSVFELDRTIMDKSFCGSNLLFIDNNIKRWFPEYMIASCSLIDLPRSFSTVKLEAFRPLKRKKKPLRVMNVAYLEPNIFWFRETTQTVSFSWEIKVKCDLRSISPFLKLVSFPKLYHSRYHLSQHYKYNATNTKNNIFRQVEWGKFRSKSSYHPTDLCSNEFRRILSAVESLIENPQNNLGIFYKEKRCFGWDIDDGEEYENKLDKFFSLSDDGADDIYLVAELRKKCKSVINCLFSLILQEEKILSEVEKLQCLDIIDCEGAYEFYNKGLELYPSCVEWDQDLLAYLQQPLEDAMKLVGDIIYNIHYPSHNGCDAFESFKDQVMVLPISSCLKSYLLLIHDSKIMMLSGSHPEEFLTRREQLRGKAFELLNMCSLDDIRFLLKLWMLSIIAKDCSVLISIRWSTSVVESESSRKAFREILERDVIGNELCDLFHLQKQHHDEYGHVKSKNLTNTENDIVFDYKIHLIDIGLKDFSKFVSKKQKDEEICQVFADGVKYL